MMNIFIARIFTPVSKSNDPCDRLLKRKCAFARMCLDQLPPLSQEQYARNSLNNPMNQELESRGFDSFNSLNNSGVITL